VEDGDGDGLYWGMVVRYSLGHRLGPVDQESYRHWR